MPWFIKTERFTKTTQNLLPSERKVFLDAHREWVNNLANSGVNILSGYLINNKKEPGGGGMLLIEARSFESARSLVVQDPMIKAELVNWTLQEWIPFAGNHLEFALL